MSKAKKSNIQNPISIISVYCIYKYLSAFVSISLERIISKSPKINHTNECANYTPFTSCFWLLFFSSSFSVCALFFSVRFLGVLLGVVLKQQTMTASEIDISSTGKKNKNIQSVYAHKLFETRFQLSRNGLFTVR